MADLNDFFFFGDDFDTILGILEDEEELDEHFKQATDEVSFIIFCSDSKYYKKVYFLVLFIDLHGEQALSIVSITQLVD